MALTVTLPTPGGDSDVWSTELNIALTAIVAAINAIGSAGVTSVDTHTGAVTAAQLRTSLAAVLTPADIGAATETDLTTEVTNRGTAIAAITPASIGAVRVVTFGSSAGTSRGGSGGVVLWVGNAGVTPTNTVSGDVVLNAS
jgi:hypothetical protein